MVKQEQEKQGQGQYDAGQYIDPEWSLGDESEHAAWFNVMWEAALPP